MKSAPESLVTAPTRDPAAAAAMPALTIGTPASHPPILSRCQAATPMSSTAATVTGTRETW